jgi:hypothetical protein
VASGDLVAIQQSHQKTAWFMLQRIRLAMQDEKRGGKLSGEIEIDETFIGGKARKTTSVSTGNELAHGAVSRSGNDCFLANLSGNP